MGPSVKFVSPNKGLISKKKMGVNFFRVKNDQTRGGGPRGVWQKTTLFHVFFLNLPLRWSICTSPHPEISIPSHPYTQKILITWAGRCQDHIVGWTCPSQPSWCQKSHPRPPTMITMTMVAVGIIHCNHFENDRSGPTHQRKQWWENL